METTACAPGATEVPSAGGPGPHSSRLANLCVVAALGLGTALAASLPALLGVTYATFGPPEITLTVLGVAVGGFALLRLLRLPVPESSRLRAVEAGMSGPRAALIGAGIGLPLLRFTGRIVIETDSARLLSSVVHARNYGYGHVRQSQEALAPHFVYRPVLALAGLPGARLVAVVSAVALVAAVAFLAWRATGSAVATVASAIAIVSMRFTMTQAPLLPLYPLMLTAGYLGAFMLWRATTIAPGRARWWLTAGGVLAIAAAPELHSLGQLFYAAPLVVALLAPAGRRLRPTLIAYAGLALATVPRLVINLSDGGLRHIRSGRVEWFVQQGYLGLINSAKHQTPTHLGYLRKGPELLADALGAWGFVWIGIVAVAVAALVPNRVRLATLAAAAVVIGAIVVQQPGPFPRYLSPLLPGCAILIGWLVARIVEQPRRIVRLAVVPVLALVVISGLSDYRFLLDDERVQETARGAGRLQIMADIVDHDSVFGARAPKLIGYNANLDPWGLSFVSEAEYRTYLTWPSTRAVLDMLERHGIEYVAVTDRDTNEIDYNQVWLGSRPRHRRELIVNRRSFCPVWHAFPLALYRVGACKPGDEGASR